MRLRERESGRMPTVDEKVLLLDFEIEGGRHQVEGMKSHCVEVA